MCNKACRLRLRSLYSLVAGKDIYISCIILSLCIHRLSYLCPTSKQLHSFCFSTINPEHLYFRVLPICRHIGFTVTSPRQNWSFEPDLWLEVDLIKPFRALKSSSSQTRSPVTYRSSNLVPTLPIERHNRPKTNQLHIKLVEEDCLNCPTWIVTSFREKPLRSLFIEWIHRGKLSSWFALWHRFKGTTEHTIFHCSPVKHTFHCTRVNT